MTSNALATHEMSSRDIHDAIGGAVHTGSSIYTLDTKALEEARPDLIITQELCSVCAVSYSEVSRAARTLDADAKIVSLEPRSVGDILEHIRLIGELTGTNDRANDVIRDADERVGLMLEATSKHVRPRVVCIEWLDPIFAAGHWVPEQVEMAGGTELLGPRGEPSPEVDWDDVVAAAPEALVLMPCGMPIERTLAELGVISARKGWDSLPAVRDGLVYAVDASSFFNRPGPRVVRGAEILAGLLHPDLFLAPDRGEGRLVPLPI